MLPISLQVISGARKAGRAPSLHQWKTPIEANSAKTSNESNLNTPNLRGDILVKKIMQKIKEGKSVHVRRARIHTL